MPVQQKTLKVRRPSREREAQDVAETVRDVVAAIREGMFDPYLDVLFKAFDDRIQKYQGEERDELPTRDRGDKLRPMKSAPVAVEPVAGRLYRIRGNRYAGVVVEYLEEAERGRIGVPTAMVRARVGNDAVKTGNLYKVPLIALEEDADAVDSSSRPPYGHTTCRKCGKNVEYSGKGRPRAFCDACKN